MRGTGRSGPRPRAPREGGASVIQIMVAVVIGAVLVTGLVEILVSTKRTYRVQEAQARVQETGRFGTELLAYETRMAGFMGCPNLDRLTPRVVASPAPSPPFDQASYLQGYEAGGGGWTPALPAPLAAATPGSDVVTVRRGGDCTASLVAAMASDGAPARLAAGNGCGFATGDLLVISDCVNADVFRASSVSTSGGVETVSHGTTANTSDRFSKPYGTDALVMRLEQTSFFIAPGASGAPALWQQRDAAAPVELVEGVESMQILYGEDLDNDLSADRYVTPDAAGFDVANVVGLRLSLLLRTLEDNVTLGPQDYTFDGQSLTAADGRLRRVYVTTVNLRNRTIL